MSYTSNDSAKGQRNNLNINEFEGANWERGLEALTNLQADLCNDQPIAIVIDKLGRLLGNYSSFAPERLDEIKDSYNYMCEYMLKGYKDEQRGNVYIQLKQKLYGLISDMILALRKKYDAKVKLLFNAKEPEMPNADEMKSALESFVSDYAMLEFEPAESREEKKLQLNDHRQSQLSKFFINILASSQWNREFSNEMQQLILSPTIDSLDAQTLISAIMISTLLVPDAGKVMALINIYSHATDDKVKQRALVGWVFAINAFDYQPFDIIYKAISNLLDDIDVCNDLLELQMQVIYCMNAEKDNETIQRDVMPTILKNQDLEITRFGIKEKVEDPMEDILYGDEADKKMEEMEKGLHKIIDMQKQGADIYFGGFSKMKRFSFFYTLCNWFMPFYPEHPQLRQISSKFRNSQFMNYILVKGPFCDSDKYSFALGLSSVFDHLPSNVQEVLTVGGEAAMPMGMNEQQLSSAVFIRRQYLQDLYRFFRISDFSTAFNNPFGNQSHDVFMTNAVFFPKLHDEAIRVVRFLMKQKMGEEAYQLLDYFMNEDAPEDMILLAQLHMQRAEYDLAEELYNKVYNLNKDDFQGLKGLALSSFYCGHYEQSAMLYKKLAEKQPEKYKQNLAISLINAKQVKEGVNILYELYYKDPSSINIKRGLAWGLLCLKHLEQAAKLYNEIMASDEKNGADYLNAGYCAWFSGNLQEAIKLLKHVRFFKHKMLQDEWLLDSYDISDTDKRIMEGFVGLP